MSITSILRNATEAISQSATRIEAELRFARMLVGLEKNGGLAASIDEAGKLAGEIFASADPGRISSGVSEIEARLAPVARLARQYTIYCVGHAHIDMNWMWGWPETVAVCNDTFQTVLKLMDEFPTFVFSQSQASVYRIIEQYNPELLKQIRKRVRQGRWEVTASHWVEGDRNMVSGESLARHLLYTRKYLQKIFGLKPEEIAIDWSPDTFGHPRSVPMYLTRGGVKHVYLHRPGTLGPTRPEAFWWKSPDGSRVLVRNDMANGYNGSFNPGIINTLERFAKQTGLRFTMFVYGVGDHGGGPTRRDLAIALEMNSWPCFPNIRFARASEFYERLEKEGARLPELDCELNFELSGCYTTQSLIKRSNRVAEHRLLDAESICAVAAAAIGRPYPASDFEEAWRDTLFCHFHDILPGSNVHDSRTWMHGLFQKTMATTSMAETQALRELAGQIKTSVRGIDSSTLPARDRRAVLGAGAGWGSERGTIDQADNSGGGPRAIVIFNPTAVERNEVVEATLWSDVLSGHITEEMRKAPIAIRTPEGTLIDAQKIEHGSYWGHAFVRIAFPAKVPSLGYSTYTVLEQPCEPARKLAGQITAPYHCSYILPDRRPEGLVNDLLRLEIDPTTGGIRRLENLKTGVSLAGQLPWGLEYALEKPHVMTAWTADHPVEFRQPQVLAIDRKLDGPYKATTEVRLRIKQSEFTLVYELRAGDPHLHIHLRGIWMERGTPQVGVPSLRYVIHAELDEIKPTYEIPYGVIQRSLNGGEEVPSLNFAMLEGSVNGQAAGLLVLNDCKHGHSLDQQTFRMTLIRSAYDPDPLPDVGQHEIYLALMPFAGRLSPAAAIAEGKSFNRPLRLVTTSLHEGKLPASASALGVKQEDVLLSEFKQSEDGKGAILRIINPTGENRDVTVAIDQRLLGKFRGAAEVDLLERPLTKSSAKLQSGGVRVRAPANALVSVKLEK